MMLARAWGIAFYEWRLIGRSRTFWVIAALLTALAWLVLEWPDLPRKDPLSANTTIAQFLGMLSSLLFIFLFAPAWLRESQRGYDMVWSRTVSSLTYLAGKMLGMAIAATMALLPAASLTGAATLWVFGPQALKSMAYTFTVILAPTVAITLAGSAFASLLLRHWLWIYLILIGLRVGILVGVGPLQLTNLTLQGVYISPSIGFGPDTDLVIWNRCFYLVLGLTGIGAAAILFPYRELRIQRPNRLGQATLFAITIMALAGAIQSASAFHTAMQQAQSSPDASREYEPIQAERADYRLSVTIDLKRNRLAGEAMLTLSGISTPSSELPLQLNPGLHVQHVLSGGHPIVWQGDGKIGFNSPLPEGQSISLAIRYEGRLLVNHRAYDTFVRRDERSPLPGGYVGQGAAHLVSDGDWYPFAGLWSPNQLDVTLLGTEEETAWVNTADQVSRVAGRQRLSWSGPLAKPLFAASSAYQEARWLEATILYPFEYQHLLERVVPPYLSAARQLDARLRSRPPSPLRVAIVALLDRPQYDSATGTLFLSEETFADYRLNFPHGTVGRDAIYQRWAAEIMTRVWWCQEHPCPTLPPHIGFFSDPAGDAVDATLLSYMALRLTESSLGAEFVVEEIKDRVEVARAGERDVFSPYPNLGISPSLFVRLDHFWDLVGPQQFWTMVSAYEARYRGQQPPSLEEFEAFRPNDNRCASTALGPKHQLMNTTFWDRDRKRHANWVFLFPSGLADAPLL